MYSVVRLAAMSAGGSAPDCFFFGGGHGCYGCYSCGCWGCYGCAGCYGCSGCYGCYGCYGGWGWGCHGCYGGYNCWGYYGCSCYGCYGGYGCGGCWGCYGCHGYGPVMVAPAVAAPMAPAAPPAGTPPAGDMKDGQKQDGEKKGEAAARRAKLVVKLPENAQLFVDDQPLKNSKTTRTFQTPPLDKGQEYFYDVRVEVERDGKKQSASKRVIVRAGELSEADFTEVKEPVVTVRADRDR